MDDALSIAIQAMHNNMARLGTISHNVANAATPGFKRSVPLAQPFSAALASARLAGVTAAGAPTLGTAVDTTAALPMQTGRALDLMVDGDAFLELRGPEGVGYARSGSFRLDPSGRLLNTQGAELQGAGGGLRLTGDEVSVKPDGTLIQNGRPVGSIHLVGLAKGPLTRGGDGLLRPAASSSGTVAAAPEGKASIRSGHLEKSNVSTVTETVNLLETSRNFEALSRLVSSYDEQIGMAIQKLGEF